MQHTHQATAGPRGAVSFFLLLNQVPTVWDSHSKAAGEEFPVRSSGTLELQLSLSIPLHCFPPHFFFREMLAKFPSPAPHSHHRRRWKLSLTPEMAPTYACPKADTPHIPNPVLPLKQYNCYTKALLTRQKKPPPKGTSPQSQKHYPNLNATPPALSQTNTNHS